MPLLTKELDLYPDDLLDRVLELPEPAAGDDNAPRWWALYTLSRREKMLMRKLRGLGVSHYGPQFRRRYRSQGGRLRESYMPVFSNYLFMHGDNAQRYTALTTNCVAKWFPVSRQGELSRDLKRLCELIETDAPLTPEDRLQAGDEVRVKTGSFAGFEGRIIRRDHRTRLLIHVRFLEQGVSVQLDDCQLERL